MWRRRAPDQLTAREQEVLALLRLGLTNEEIAQRLGVTVAGAKYHVSQILSKLGVATREEAAALAFGERRRWWLALPLTARIAGAATLAAVVAGLVVLANDVLSGSTEESPPADAAGLTVEQTYARIRDSITRPGSVFHTTISPVSTPGRDRHEASLAFDTDELWLDGTSDVLRFHDGVDFGHASWCSVTISTRRDCQKPVGQRDGKSEIPILTDVRALPIKRSRSYFAAAEISPTFRMPATLCGWGQAKSMADASCSFSFTSSATGAQSFCTALVREHHPPRPLSRR